MTVFVPTTSSTAAGVRHTVTATDTLLINAGISVGSTNDRVIDAFGTTASVFIAGMVFGGGAATGVEVSQGTIELGQTGSVFSNASGGGGAILLSAGAGLTNDGTIAASQGIGVIMTDANTNVMNSGRISGGTGGVFMGLFDTANQLLTNTGSISSGVRPDLGLRHGHGVQIEGDFATISNAGDIRASATGKAAIHLSGFDETLAASGVRIANAGTIESLLGWGVDGIDNLTAGFTLVNSGTIGGGAGAVRGTAGADVITNSGTLAGTITLGDGADRYVGTLARTDVTITMGVGHDAATGGAFDDVLYGGNDRDTLRGGAGDDSLYGGSGDDSLVGGTGDDLLVGGAGNDLYHVNTLADLVSEVAGTADRVTSGTISLDLNLYQNVEAAILTGNAALRLTGSAVANALTGNAAGNVIAGGAGADTIAGGDGADVMTGGTGRDSLTGGAGADVFVLLSAAETEISALARDTITDFAGGVDDLRTLRATSRSACAHGPLPLSPAPLMTLCVQWAGINASFSHEIRRHVGSRSCAHQKCGRQGQARSGPRL